MNSLAVMRLLSHLGSQGAPIPVGSAEPPRNSVYYEERPARHSKPSRRREPSFSSESSESDYSETSSSDSESSYSDYEDHEVARGHFREKPCEYISPAGLEQRKGKKEFYGYLKEKGCPRVEAYKKEKAPKPAKPAKAPKAPPAEPKPRGRSKKVEEAPAPPAPTKPKKADTKTTEKPLSDFQIAIRKYRAQGMPFVEAVVKAREETRKDKD